MKLPPSCNANAAEVGEAYMLFDCIRQIPIPIPTSWAMGGVWLISRAEVFETSVLRCGMSLVMSSVSKYPPAEPEALGFEPLKAARSSLMPTSFWVLHVRTIVPNIRISQRQIGRFSSPPSFVSQSNIQKQKTVAYSRKCQTSTATPAEPGISHLV